MTDNHRGTDVSLGAQFLGTFNEIESHFRESLNYGEHMNFGEMVRTYSEHHKLTREQVKALNVFAALRNTISHQNYYDGRPIAEPVAQVVEMIKELRDRILRPPTALSCLGGRRVSVIYADSPITAVLDLVRKYDYSQVPVYKGDEYTGLLTTNCIARWLADRFDTVTLAESEPVEAVMSYAEAHDIAKLVPKTITAAMALDRLSNPNSKGTRPTALIITESGRSSEKPLGVVVDADIPALSAALSLSRRKV